MQARPLDWTALTLVIIGAINWGLIGFFKFDPRNILVISKKLRAKIELQFLSTH